MRVIYVAICDIFMLNVTLEQTFCIRKIERSEQSTNGDIMPTIEHHLRTFPIDCPFHIVDGSCDQTMRKGFDLFLRIQVSDIQFCNTCEFFVIHFIHR